MVLEEWHLKVRCWREIAIPREYRRGGTFNLHPKAPSPRRVGEECTFKYWPNADGHYAEADDDTFIYWSLLHFYSQSVLLTPEIYRKQTVYFRSLAAMCYLLYLSLHCQALIHLFFSGDWGPGPKANAPSGGLFWILLP